MWKKQSSIVNYQNEYIKDYGFEKVMVWARQRYLHGLIESQNPNTVIEIGCGYHHLFEKVSDVESIQRWFIVEPSPIFSSHASEQLRFDNRVQIIQGFFEDVVESFGFPEADLCICSCLLHEVEKPDSILLAAKKILKKRGVLHVNVPNAKSFHRVLAHEMGLIDSPYQFSDRNIALSQKRVFDADALRALVEEVGFSVIEAGGYFMKPFSHKQMEMVVDHLGDGILEGLWKMGVKFPELASEIYMNVGLR